MTTIEEQPANSDYGVTGANGGENAAGTRDPRYDVLFERVRLGPIWLRNRFVQVPHCNGMGYRDPTAQAEMRRIKAEGGWALICTEQVEIHPTSDVTPFIELRLWDDGDVPALARIAEAIHAGGSLAGIELAHNGMNAPNLTSREPPFGPAHLPVATWANDPVQARKASKTDLRNLRRWHRDAVRRSLDAGYDAVYVYAGHNLSILQHFLSPRYNRRTDEYGGSLENRARLLREVLSDTREECEGRAAVLCRLSIEEDAGDAGITRDEIKDLVGLLDELPDAWDFVLGSWELDSTTSRFSGENEREPLVIGLKTISAKPIIGVGRFTSPDTMVTQVRRGILDLIGAARPSIADPFLPKKIEEGRLDDIRECIGCNICVSGDMTMSPIRCTQNPTMGEEWRRGWHPEHIRAKSSEASVLVIGGGPSGLETARALGQRGYRVVLTEAGRDFGGRVIREAALPGLAAWRRVVDYRLGQIAKSDTVELYRESELSAQDAISYGFSDIVVATGATWRSDGVGRWHTSPIEISTDAVVLTPEDIFSGHAIARRGAERKRVVVYDDDHYYLGGLLAEFLAAVGHDVRLVTPASLVSAWTAHTLEIGAIQQRVLTAGITIDANRALVNLTESEASLACVFTGTQVAVAADVALLVTARLPNDSLYHDLESLRNGWETHGVHSVTCIGDAWAPGTIAAAVWEGHRCAEEFGLMPDEHVSASFRREYTALAER